MLENRLHTRWNLLIGALSGTTVNAMAMDDTGLPGYRDSKSVLPHASQEPICLADIAWPVRDNKLACKRKCLSCMFFFSGLSTFQESVAMDRIQRIMGVLQNPCMGWVSCCFSSPSLTGDLRVGFSQHSTPSWIDQLDVVHLLNLPQSTFTFLWGNLVSVLCVYAH